MLPYDERVSSSPIPSFRARRGPFVPGPRARSIAAAALLLGLASALPPADARQEPSLAPADPGAAQAPEDLGALLEPIRTKNGVPALGALVLRGHEVTALGVAGVRKQGDPTLATDDDLWHLGSCTKSMTATLLALLIERGKLSWNTTVAEVFEEDVPDLDSFWADVTLELLLQHRGGAPGDVAPALWMKLWLREGTPREQRMQLVRGVIVEPPVNEPGRVFLYSNAGYAIAGAMAEEVTDRAWEDLMREELFQPLGMKSAGFGPPGSSDGILQPLGHESSEGRLVPLPPGPQADNPPAIGPAGTVHASLRDWARYAAFHIAGERGELPGGALLSNETVRRLHAPPAEGNYALGWGVGTPFPGAGRMLMHSGSNTLWLSSVYIAPEQDLVLLLVANSGDKGAEGAIREALPVLLERAQAEVRAADR